MNKSIKAQLEEIESILPPESTQCKKQQLKEDLEYCKMVGGVNPDLLGPYEPTLKPTESPFTASNDINPTQDGLKVDEGLNGA